MGPCPQQAHRLARETEHEEPKTGIPYVRWGQCSEDSEGGEGVGRRVAPREGGAAGAEVEVGARVSFTLSASRSSIPHACCPRSSPPVRLMAPDALQVAQEGSSTCNITWDAPQTSHYITKHLEFEVRTRFLDHSWAVSTGPGPACPDSYAAHLVRPPSPQRWDSPRQPCRSSVGPAPASSLPPSLPPCVPRQPRGSSGWQVPGWPQGRLHSPETGAFPLRSQRPWDAPSPLFQSS